MLSRKQKKLVAFLSDVIIVIVIAAVAFLIRFEGIIPVEHRVHLGVFTFFSLGASIPVFFAFGIYRFSLGAVSISELVVIIKAVGSSVILTTALLFLLRDASFVSGFPRSIIILNGTLLLLGICGTRIGKRLFYEARMTGVSRDGIRTLIIGAGGAGEELVRALKKRQTHAMIGFLDDAEQKRNTSLHGIPVVGTRNELAEHVVRFGIEEIIIAMPSAPPSILRETVHQCRAAGVTKIKITPSLREVVDGKITLANIRDVAIADLLGRTPISIDTSMIREFIADKRVLVTGAAGSIGSFLCQQILTFAPQTLIAFDKSETPLFYLERNLRERDSRASLVFEIGSIGDEQRMRDLFFRHRPQVVFHAAAYKHVPLMERHPLEAISNNVLGTEIVARIAHEAGVEAFVMISTDKAVNPTSVMGATKRMCEIVCSRMNADSGTRFCAVRFGNVLDSQGNVIELFRKQIECGGPVEVTHPEMKRYFMVTSEACLLVLQAGAMTEGGEVFVLDMGEPVRIIDLARDMITLSGYMPDSEIPLVFTGLRPGEKLYEEIIAQNEIPTKNDKIYIVRNGSNVMGDRVDQAVRTLKECVARQDGDGAVSCLWRAVSDFE